MATADLRAPKPKDSVTTLTIINQDSPDVVTFRADVQPAKGGPTPTGMVNFKDGQTLIASVAIGGSYDAKTRPQTVTAYYGGDSQYLPSQSATVTPP